MMMMLMMIAVNRLPVSVIFVAFFRGAGVCKKEVLQRKQNQCKI